MSRTGERGFTLIEMMIVVAIIAILVGILVPNFMRARAQAQTAACEANLKEIATALEEYETDHEAYPDVTSLTDVTNSETNLGQYLRQTPIDPVAPTGFYQYQVTNYNAGNASYTIICPGSHDPATLTPSWRKLDRRAHPICIGDGLYGGGEPVSHEHSRGCSSLRRRFDDERGAMRGAALPCVDSDHCAHNGSRALDAHRSFRRGATCVQRTLGYNGLADRSSNGFLTRGLCDPCSGISCVRACVRSSCERRASIGTHEQPSSGASLLSGGTLGLVLSPCCTPVVAMIASVGVTSGSFAASLVNAAAFAAGHVAPLTMIGLGAGAAERFAPIRVLSGAATTISGGLSIALAAYYGLLA